jgi:hypothetical protein
MMVTKAFLCIARSTASQGTQSGMESAGPRAPVNETQVVAGALTISSTLHAVVMLITQGEKSPNESYIYYSARVAAQLLNGGIPC